MLNLLLGTDWIANRDYLLNTIAENVTNECPGQILIVPELISHDMERRLAETAGDTASRFAEVLSFTRLACRVADSVGSSTKECLDNGGRVVAMAAAVHQVFSRLKAYASVGTKPEFLMGLVEAVDEFKRCCISSADLKRASEESEGSLAQKLEELSLILESYDLICRNGKRDPADQMTWLLEELESCDFAKVHTFFIDGFPDFTRQHMSIIENLIVSSDKDVTVSLLCDKPDASLLAFEKAGETAGELIRIAKRNDIAVNITYSETSEACQAEFCSKLFQGKTDTIAENLSLFRTDTVYQECAEVAQRISVLVQGGARYRDIGVVCADIGTYRNMVSAVFNRFKIPAYLSGTDDILEKPVIVTILSAIDIAMNGFGQKDVLRYLKTSLSPLDEALCDMLENYVILWGITGDQWLSDWTQHPDGLGRAETERSLRTLSELNDARRSVIEPLNNLQKGLTDAKNLAEMTEALYAFFEETQLPQQLTKLAENFDSVGDNRNCQILNQLWEILVCALEQMHDTLGELAWDADVFSRLFRLLLSQYTVGTIPTVLDTVIIGPVSAMRCQQTKHLFVMGAVEGSFPCYGSISGVLTDQERTHLRALGLPLTGGALDGLKVEFSEIYSVFSGAADSITVSCPSGQPSFVYQRLRQMAAHEEKVTDVIGPALVNPSDAAAYFVRANDGAAAESLGLSAEYAEIIAKTEHALGNVKPDNIRKLYGNELYLSASQVDKQANCRFAYYLKYGLRLNERKPITIDPAEFGTYIHDVLEKTVCEVMESGGFSKVNEDEMMQIALKHSGNYARQRFGALTGDRLNYLFNRNERELRLVITDLWEELKNSKFVPKYYELGFGIGSEMPAIQISGSQMTGKLRGFVDRVDVWQDGDKTYFRVVDYKTGMKSFDYCDVINGIGLQMLLYLFALEDGGQDLIGVGAIPAGVQYVPARATVLTASGFLSEEEITKKRTAEQKRKGLLLADEAVLQAMEPAQKPIRLSYSRTKEGSLSGDVAQQEQLSLLKQYVYSFLGNMVDDISSGSVAPNPYYRDDRTNACRFCPYGEVCHRSDVQDHRVFKSISSNAFWDEIRKEMHVDG